MTSRSAELARSLDAVTPLFQTHRRFVLTTHVNPDGDGLGSEMALASSLRSAGKDVRIINHSPTPAVYRFLDPGGTITLFAPQRDTSLLSTTDVIVIMDTNHPDRLASMSTAVLASSAVKVCIDHHLNADPFAGYYLLDDDATSTGEIVYRLLTRLRGPSLPADVATALYCAIMTDTGSFRYPRVDQEIHTMISHLIECGADPVQIFAEVYERWSQGRMKLLGETLSGLRTGYEGRLASICITRDMLRRTGTTEEDTENFTTYPMMLEGVLIGIFFMELTRGVKISFRSKGDIRINELAQEFGGDGHKNAAGTRVKDGAIDEVRERVVAAAGQYLSQHHIS